MPNEAEGSGSVSAVVGSVGGAVGVDVDAGGLATLVPEAVSGAVSPAVAAVTDDGVVVPVVEPVRLGSDSWSFVHAAASMLATTATPTTDRRMAPMMPHRYHGPPIADRAGMVRGGAGSVGGVFLTDSFVLDELLDDLATLVSIESPSHDTAALERSALAVSALFERRLGTPATLVPSAAGPHVHWSDGADEPSVLLLGHHDTVFPAGTLRTRPFTVADGRATGPGAFDMKAGIVLAVHALAARRAAGHPVSGVECLFTSDEEVGSAASRALLEERAVACGSVLVLEPSADGGALKTGRKGCGTFEVSVTGRAAHAGLEPEKGANALVELAHQIVAISALGRPDEGTTVTPTVATAGTADNVVPASACVRVDVRIETADERRRVEQAMAALKAVDPDVQVEVTGDIGRPPMPESASTGLFETAGDVATELGLEPLNGVFVGGGSDGNFTAALGVPTLDGLGAVGGGAHADHEWVDVASLEHRVVLLAALIGRLVDPDR